MARKKATAPRKRPRQERSRALVEAILDAAARLLVRDGYEGTTTNRIAEIAGVSVGSLYQYFPNKESIVRALLERHVEEALSLRPARLDDSRLSLRERFRLSVEWHLAAHAADPKLHRVLTSLAPSVLGTQMLGDFELSVQATIRAVLERHVDEIRPENVEVASFLVATTLEASTHAAVLRRPELLDDPDLASELTELIGRYLDA